MERLRLKSSLAGVSHWTGADRLWGTVSGFRRMPLVLGYHRVVEDFASQSGHTMPPMLVDRPMLEQQLDWVAQTHRFVSLDELGSRLESGEPAGGLAALTFDDGYRDVYEQAFPLLTRKGIPAAVFVVTDLVDTSRLLLHDRLFLLLDRASRLSHPLRNFGRLLQQAGASSAESERLAGSDALRLAVWLLDRVPQAALHHLVQGLEADDPLGEREEMRPLTWDMLREMQAQGVTVGSHTRSHALLPIENDRDRRHEIAGSREALQKELGAEVRHFAYPAGGFDAQTVEDVSSAGYRFGYTTCRHRNPQHPLLTIPRVLLWQGSAADAGGRFSSSLMSCLVNGVLPLTHRCRARHGQLSRGYGAHQERLAS